MTADDPRSTQELTAEINRLLALQTLRELEKGAKPIWPLIVFSFAAGGIVFLAGMICARLVMTGCGG